MDDPTNQEQFPNGHFREGPEYQTLEIPDIQPGDIMMFVINAPDLFHWVRGPFEAHLLPQVLSRWADQYAEVEDCVDFFYKGVDDDSDISGSFVVKQIGSMN